MFNKFASKFKFPSMPTMAEAIAPKAKLGGGGGSGPKNPITFQPSSKQFSFTDITPKPKPQEDWGASMFEELEGEFDRFMNGEWVSWPSTNCVGGAYYPERIYMELEFKDGTYYGYSNVGSEEAASMFRATSHGGWVWDNLRIRGTKLGYRKEYQWLSAPSAIARKWDATTATAQAHGIEAKMQTMDALQKEALGRLSQGIKGQFR